MGVYWSFCVECRCTGDIGITGQAQALVYMVGYPEWLGETTLISYILR
jgi:hypothetical protein